VCQYCIWLSVSFRLGVIELIFFSPFTNKTCLSFIISKVFNLLFVFCQLRCAVCLGVVESIFFSDHKQNLFIFMRKFIIKKRKLDMMIVLCWLWCVVCLVVYGCECCFVWVSVRWFCFLWSHFCASYSQTKLVHNVIYHLN